jgi:hypothetical protein
MADRSRENSMKTTGDGGRTDRAQTSKLGARLRELSEKAIASGVELLSTEQIHDRISEVRGR